MRILGLLYRAMRLTNVDVTAGLPRRRKTLMIGADILSLAIGQIHLISYQKYEIIMEKHMRAS